MKTATYGVWANGGYYYLLDLSVHPPSNEILSPNGFNNFFFDYIDHLKKLNAKKVCVEPYYPATSLWRHSDLTSEEFNLVKKTTELYNALKKR